MRERVLHAGAIPDPTYGTIARRPWAERSFYAHDPWGNRFGVVERGTEYRGGSFPSP